MKKLAMFIFVIFLVSLTTGCANKMHNPQVQSAQVPVYETIPNLPAEVVSE